jgi:TolB-like protein/Flp pilus assembly protein TadD
VLPFANLSGDEKNEYFSDGMSEELINLLTRVPGLQVAARTSSFAYKERSVDVRTVAEELAVETVLEGSVRWAGDRVRITAQLIDAETGYHLWSDTYDERLENIFEVQDRIARAIVDALEVTLARADEDEDAMALPAAPTRDVQAYDQYLKARDIVRRRGERNIRLALDLFQSAVGRDPGFAQAYAGLASAYVLLPTYTDDATAPALELASEAAVKALTLDAGLAEAHAVLALINQIEWNWTDAEAGFFAATGLQPGEPTPQHWYSVLLRTAGRSQQSLEAGTKALELDPASAVLNASLAVQYMLLGDDARAAEFGAEAERLGYGEKLGDLRAIAALRGGEPEAAVAGLLEGGTLLDVPPELAETFAGAVVDPGRRPAFLAELGKTDMAAGARLTMLIFLNARDEAFAAAEEILETSRIDLPLVAFWLPEAAAIRSDPRFVGLMTKVGLPDYWKRYGWSDFCAPQGEGFICR